MGYFRYNDDEKAKETIAHAQTQIQSLIEINAQYGIQGGYQNHTGNYFGAPLWDLIGVLEKVASPWISSQFDIYHAYSEGYRSWEVGMEIMAQKFDLWPLKISLGRSTMAGLKLKKHP